MPRVNIKDLGIGTGTISYKEPRKTGWVKCLDPYPYVPYLGTSFAGTFGDTGKGANRVVTLEGRLCNMWRLMMHRCYSPQHTRYKFYGAKGVSVCARWHNVHAYIHDIQRLKGWDPEQFQRTEIVLDKDYYGSNQYNPEACQWLPESENVEYIGNPIRHGSKVYLSSYHLERATGLQNQNVRNTLKGQRPWPTWSDNPMWFVRPFEYAIKEGYVFRYLN
ncbi:MAG: hypothetical protein GY776_08805 [Alteromonas sp.]|nr:hypothetical protein [Alteromonas sp.]